MKNFLLSLIRKSAKAEQAAVESFPYGRNAVAPDMKARAAAFAQENPQPRAMYLLG